MEKVILTHFTHSSKAASAEGDYISFVQSEKCSEGLLCERWGGRESFMLRPASPSDLDMWSLEASLTQMGFQRRSGCEDVSLTR